MAIENLKDGQIADNIRRYREQRKIEGGHYSLGELLAEQARRLKTPFGVVETVNAIIRTAKASPDGLTTYLDIWKSFTDEPWVGNHSQSQVANALGRVVHYCRANGMPILTTLVVQSAGRRLSGAAKNNIYNEARELGLNPGADIDAFIEDQRRRSRALVEASEPMLHNTSSAITTGSED